MRIATWNVNGIRAAVAKGFTGHVAHLAPDVLLLQEVRALPDQVPAPWDRPDGWTAHWHPAEKKGYAGTAALTRAASERVGVGMDGAADPEGRVLQVRAEGIRFVSVYLPSGSRSAEAQAAKEAWMARFARWTADLAASPEPVILAGDLNVAHTPLDIHDPRGNAKNSGFLPHERDWFGALLDQGWRDLLRERVGPVQGPYSWWSNRGQARAKDRGWRIDYVLANAAAPRCTHAFVHRDGGLEVSDHAPVVVDLG